MSEILESVAIIGGGVAGLTAAWSLARRGVDVVVLERSPRLGGLVETERPLPGVMLEHGADALLASKPGGLSMLKQLGLESALVTEGRATRRAFVATPAGLTPMPAGLFAFERRALFTMMSSPLISMSAKLRLVFEPLSSRHGDEDESVASFFTRRLGPEVEQKLVAPMIRGIYGAPTTELGVRSVFPKLAGMEDRFGSVGLALLFAERSPRGTGLVALSGGMDSIAQTLAAQTLAPRDTETGRGGRISLESGVSSIELARPRAGKRGVRISLESGATLEVDAVVVATDVQTATRLLSPLDRELGELLGAVRSTDAEVVSLAYARSAVAHPLDGTGFVVDHPGRATLACTFASEKWHGRAPAELAVFRSVLRGAPELDDAELTRVAHEELASVVGLTGEPSMTRLRRRRQALPLYGVGHRTRIARALELARALGGVALAGNYLGGVGVPDAISSGLAAASELLGRTSSAASTAA